MNIYFQFGAIMNRTVNIFVHLGDECITLFSWIYTGVGLLAHRFAYNQPYLDFTVVQSGFTNDTTINSVKKVPYTLHHSLYLVFTF